jgi:hypothetical protein
MVRSQLCATRFLCGLVPSLGCPSSPAHTCFCTRFTQKEGKKWGTVPTGVLVAGVWIWWWSVGVGCTALNRRQE